MRFLRLNFFYWSSLDDFILFFLFIGNWISILISHCTPVVVFCPILARGRAFILIGLEFKMYVEGGKYLPLRCCLSTEIDSNSDFSHLLIISKIIRRKKHWASYANGTSNFNLKCILSPTWFYVKNSLNHSVHVLFFVNRSDFSLKFIDFTISVEFHTVLVKIDILSDRPFCSHTVCIEQSLLSSFIKEILYLWWEF